MDEETKTLIKSIYEQNKEIKNDIGLIKKDLHTLSKKIQDLEDSAISLKSDNIETKRELEIIRRKLKENNLIIFGIKEEENINTVNTVKKTLKEQLDIDLEEADINNSYRVGQQRTDKPRPIILELKRYLTKQLILQNSRKLKGTDIAISHDRTEKEREEGEVLYRHYKEARQQNSKARIYKNKIVINGKTFKYEDLKDQVRETRNVEEKSNNEKNISSPLALQHKKNTRSTKEKRANK